MSNRRFIEVTSAHRNRNQYPNPAEFEIPFSPSRSLNQNQTIRGAYTKSPSTTPNIIYNQNIDVADTVTTGIVENYWYGNNGLIDSGVVTSSCSLSGGGPNYTMSVSGLTNTTTNPITGAYISINNSVVGEIIAGSTPTTIIFSVTYPIVFNTTLIKIGFTFTILYYETTLGSIIDNSTLQATDTTTTGVNKFYINVSGLSSPYKNIPNYYVGYLLVINTTLPLTPCYAGIINYYNPNNGEINVVIPLLTTQTWTGGNNIKIIDPSNCTSSPITLTPIPVFGGNSYVCPAKTLVIPSINADGKVSLNYDQCYNNYYVVYETPIYSSGTPNQSTNVSSSQIVSYNFLTNTASLSTPFTSWSTNVTSSLLMNRYSIRKTLPNQIYTSIVGTGSPGAPGTTLTSVSNYQSITLNNCIFLPSSASQIDNYYTGQYIYVYPNQTANNQITPLSNIEGSCFYINSYVGNEYNACFVLPISPPNVSSPTQYYPSYTSQSTQLPNPGTVINIVNFANDNYNPLIYNGSVVSQNETVAYEINLVNLTLPNIVLTTGSRAAFYPYLYVELSNVTASSSSSKNIIYSNNPNSTRALFLVPITDISDPIRSPFIKLDAGSMVQTVKFKPNDCLRFSVFLPNGQLYTTVMSDYYSPSEPNPFVQIDALFGIKRLTGV